jgi:hypothetical protein
MTVTPTTPTASPLAETAPPDRGRRVRRLAAGASITGAGVLTLAGFLTAPWEGGPTETDYLHSLTGHPGQAMLSMVVLHFGYLLLVPFAFVAARLARGGAPKLAAAGLVLGVLGSGLSAVVLTDAYDLAIAQNVPLAEALRIEDGMSVAGFMAIGLTSVVGTVLGSVLLTAALWRARWTSWLPAVAMLAGWAVGYGAHDLVRACSGAALVALSLVAVGVRVLRSTDEQFDTGIPA